MNWATEGITPGSFAPSEAESSDTSTMGRMTPRTENSFASPPDHLDYLSQGDSSDQSELAVEKALFSQIIMTHCEGISALLPIVYTDERFRQYMQQSIVNVIAAQALEPRSPNSLGFISDAVTAGIGQMAKGPPDHERFPEVHKALLTVSRATLESWFHYAHGKDLETMRRRLRFAETNRDNCQQLNFDHNARIVGGDLATRLGISGCDEVSGRTGDTNVRRHAIFHTDFVVTDTLEGNPNYVVDGDWTVSGTLLAKNIEVKGDFIVAGDFSVGTLRVTDTFSVQGDLRVGGNFTAQNIDVKSFTIRGRLIVGRQFVVENDFTVRDDIKFGRGSDIRGGFIVKGRFKAKDAVNVPCPSR